jgi:PKD repeat protein
MGSRLAVAALTFICIAGLAACGGKLTSALGLGGSGASLRVLDSAGRELAGAARLDVVPEGYAIYALDSRPTGFILDYGAGRHVVNVARGDYFSAEDAYLAVSDLPGRVDIGGYQLGSGNPVLSSGEFLVARIVLAPGGSGRTVASVLPTGAGCTPADFSYSAAGGSATFRWAYRSVGDYNQDGEVDISDLTPLGANFAKDSSAPDWASASLADGDGNGLVTLADITPIGQHYLTVVSGYKLERASAQAGPFTAVASLDLDAGTKSPALGFSYQDPAAVSGDWYRVRAFGSADPASGAAADPLQVSLAAPGDPPTPAFTYAPAAPLVGDAVQFTDASTGGPTIWAWSFGDGATSQQQNPAHVYAQAGAYTVTLSAKNAHGARNVKQNIGIASPPPPDNPADTFVALASASLNAAGTAFTIHSSDLPDGTDILFGPHTQGPTAVDNHLVMTYPYRGGLDEPDPSHQDISTLPGVIGMTVAGLVIYGATNASTITRNGATWTYNANAARINGEDEFGGHASQQNGGQYHYHDVDFVSKNSWVGVPGFDGQYAWSDGHSKLVGWAMDGYPIYGPYGYTDPLNPASGVTRMTPSWQSTNTGANRPPAVDTTAASAANSSKFLVLPSDPGALGLNPGMRLTLVDGAAPAQEVWIVNQQNITYVGGGHPPYMGPANGVELDSAVTVAAGATLHFEFLPGLFIEDNVYTGSGTLDRYNGRYCVTPDFPGGTYAYFCTMDANGDGVYPYMVGPELYGSATVGGTPGTGYVKPAG